MVPLFRAGCRFAFLDAPLSVVRVHAATKTMSRASDRYREIGALLIAAGGPSLKRLGTLLSFYEYDLQNLDAELSGPDDAHPAVAGLSRLPSRPSASGEGDSRHRVLDDLVRGECRVDLPWYGDGANVDITVSAIPRSTSPLRRRALAGPSSRTDLSASFFRARRSEGIGTPAGCRSGITCCPSV